MEGRTTHLFQYHKLYSFLTTFAGFTMPLWYKSISEEHLAVRNSAGLWDISHMGRLAIFGSDTTKFLDHFLTTDVSNFPPGRAFYSLLCNDKGGIVDDMVTLKLGEEYYLLVVNASNREKDFAWLSKDTTSINITIQSLSDQIALLSLQGPKAEQILQKLTDEPLANLHYYHHIATKIEGSDIIISRTGYTGEDGFEIFVLNCPLNEPDKAEKIWNRLLSLGRPLGLLPCGLGARDTLRLEAGMCLYGEDIDEDVTPLEAGLERVVKFDKGDFYGKQFLSRQINAGISKQRVCFRMKAGGIPRSSYRILKAGKDIGYVTSGTFSPLLRTGIGMGYVSKEESFASNQVEILVRGRQMDAVLVTPPFYDTVLYGRKRQHRA